MKTNDYYMRNKKNHIRACINAKDTALKSAYDRKQSNKEKYGTNDHIILIGESDRLSLNAPQEIEDEQMQKSYSYGYFERGSRVLAGKFNQGQYSEEQQRNFGICDVMYNVPEKFLTNLKEFPSYLSGRLYGLGSKAYDYVVENNMSLDDYIGLMSIIYPEVTAKEFKEGFLVRENELNQRKGSR